MTTPGARPESSGQCRVLKPPTPLPVPLGTSIFLAGSIEMGTADDWQNVFSRALADLDVVILNPRRDEWDAGWVQSIHNRDFREQVEWELAAQERTTLIAMYFAPDTKSPITLLELGLAARSGKLLVCCPEGFWRRGNVEVVCARHGVPLVERLDELIEESRKRIVSTL